MRQLATVITVLTVAVPAIGAESLLSQLVGQTCRGTPGMFDVVYTIDQKNGQWAVHDLFGQHGSAESTMKDVGWLTAKVEGSSLTFQGMSARITLTAKDPHTVDAHFMQTDPARPGVVDRTLTCSPTPADQRWH